jgi:uncharacterized protein (DUF58 family)
MGADNGRPQALPGDDTFKGIKVYAPGDPIRIVHWPATARWGELMVKEMEAPTAAELDIVVDLRGGPEETEKAASVAAGLARAGLLSGVTVFLLTAEGAGPRIGAVSTPVEVGRRLARAVADGPPPESTHSSVIRVSAR